MSINFDEEYKKWKKIGFPYARNFIDYKKIFGKMRDYIEGKNTNSKLTYAIHDKQGLDHNNLRQILNSKLWTEVPITSPTADFAWVGATIGNDYLKYEESIYSIKTVLKNLLVGGGVKGETVNKDVITNKACLYENMKRRFPDIYKKYMPDTKLLKDVHNIKEGEIYIIRPIGPGAGGGAGVKVITNNKELETVRYETKKYKSVIISEYIKNPLLYKEKKFHLRMYFMVCVGEPYGKFSWHVWNKGKIVTAELPYKKDDYTNPKIHDTHFKSTPMNLWFSEDLGITHTETTKILAQMNEILRGAAEIIKPEAKTTSESKYGFEIFGVDFIITDELIVKLIEINARHDYGKDDKIKPELYHNFCDEFFVWINKYAIIPVFEKNNYIKKDFYRLDREKFLITENIKFRDEYLSIFIPMEDFNEIDILIDYFTENSRIKVKKDNLSGTLSLYNYYHETDLLKRAIELLQSQNKKITFETLRDSFYNFKEIYNASAESTLFYLTIIKILFIDKNINELKELRILDGAGGYGTRLLACIVLECYYIGIEPNTMSTPGFKEMIELLGNNEKQIMYEDGLPNSKEILKLKNDSQDIIMFSPPMWDGEIYSDDINQSINMFKDFNSWKNGFLHKSLEVLWSKLKKGGYAIFQSIRYNLIREYMQTLKDGKFQGVISRKTYGGRNKPNWIWKKI